MEHNALAKKFNTAKLIGYTVPTIIMMVFMSMYTIVDGIFVSNFVSEQALAAVNIAFPMVLVAMAIGLMLAIGANAIIAKRMGEGKNEQARSFFTLIYIVGGVLGIAITLVVMPLVGVLMPLLGASEAIAPLSSDYLLCLLPFVTLLFFQVYTQNFFITAGKPMLGFISCVLGGIANIVLDYVLIVMADMGITGAAVATGIGYSIPGVFGLIYFAVKRKGTLYFVKPVFEGAALIKSLSNGMSELVTSLSSAITMMIFNIIMMNIAGENGVAAITVIMYIQMLQMAIYTGYSFGVSPIISYKYGEQNHAQLKQINKTSFLFLIVVSVVTVLVSLIFAPQAVGVFIAQDSPTFALAVGGFRIYAVAYLFMGINVYGSAMFTALSNGKVSAFLSFVRTLVFIVIALLTLPMLFGVNGVWVAVPIAEALAILLFIKAYRDNRPIYNY